MNSTELLISLIALLFGIAIGWGISHFLGKTSSEGAVATAQDLEKLKNEITNLSLSLRSKEGESELLKNQLEQEQQKSKANDFIEIQFRAMTDLVERLKRDAVEADRRRSTTEGELKAKIEEMTNKSALLATQTQAIAGALTNSQNRGRFGEAHLERLLDSAGLVRGIHYFAQQDIADDVHGEERSLRPDITIKMPNSREIYIDSKFPFQRFYEAYESEDETLRQSLLQEHTKDLLKHCEALSKKKYSASISSPDFVIVFAPIESIFTEALRSDPGFLDKIYKYGVTVATPTSLFAILRTVGDVFSRYQVAESASEIQGLASKFLADISSLYEKVKTVGDRLSSTVKAYNEMVPTAEKTILRNVKKMRELNVSGPEVKAIEEISLPVRELKSKIAISGHGEDIEEAIELSFEEEE